MRKIKFRAWNLNNKCFIYLELQNNKIPENFILDEKGQYKLFEQGTLIIKKFKEWQQYTGIKDKNCKEIYEGDILKWTHPDFEEHKREYKFLEMSDIRNALMIEPDCLNGWIEIIGNIYENKELLK